MPVPNIEQLKQKEASLKKLIADQGESTDRTERRALGKKLRRVQRRRRKLAIEVARRTAKPKAAPEAAAGETEAAETPEAKEE
jgi:hypothetical protein